MDPSKRAYKFFNGIHKKKEDGVYMHCPEIIKNALHIVAEIYFEKPNS